MDQGSILRAVGLVVAAYLVGGIPWGIVIARVIGGPDPRTLGSGRTGGANVLRALGPRAAIAAGLLDVAKGVVSTLLPVVLGAGPVVQVLAALAAILGHSRSPYIRFGGGRGVSVAWGSLLVIQPIVAAGVIPVFAAVLLASRISSLASLSSSAIAAAATVAAVAILNMAPVYYGYAVAAAAMIWLFHADNIQRLLSGQERRIDIGRRA